MKLLFQNWSYVSHCYCGGPILTDCNQYFSTRTGDAALVVPCMDDTIIERVFCQPIYDGIIRPHHNLLPEREEAYVLALEGEDLGEGETLLSIKGQHSTS